MSYLALKHLHITAVLISGTGFFLRGLLMLGESPLLTKRWLKVVPHVVDTVLLGSAIIMAILSAQYPFTQDWLTAKFFGLLAYILLGMMFISALRPATSRMRTCFCWTAIRPSSWKREKARLTVSSLRPR
jgi:uncharacterized membrane protein SirB2